MAAMSEEASLHHSFFWENQSWPFSVSDNYNNNINSSSGGGGSQERKKAPQPPPSSSNKMKRGGGNKGSSSGDNNNNNNNNRVVKEGKGSDGGGGGGESDDHEIHIWTERERRKKMRNMFANLHALLPQLPPKADKSTIVDEAVNYIKTLQQTLQKLQKQKLERLQGVATCGYEPAPSIINPQKLALNSREAFLADQDLSSTNNLAIETTSNVNSTNLVSISPCPVVFQTWTSSNVVLNICGDEAHISVCSQKKLGLFTTICSVLEKNKIEVNRGCDQLTEAIPADKSTIVDEAVNYIKTLQQTLQKLQKQKLERLQGVATCGYEPAPLIINPQKLALKSREAFLADQKSSSTNNLAIEPTNNINSTNLVSVSPCPVVFQTWTSSNVVLNSCGDETHINVCSPKKLGLFTTICSVLEKHKIERQFQWKKYINKLQVS
ncbi:hypothetical protein Pint_33929 [Pistacia integerrima]|uniref:Uncharacterized protein n=1 Tax=Pistacia integerrima TaxID=434235 RepID=A0ACC0X888_9ROSI|nr:hypothetical protein Pint_33929 [Pistacia integerrima]